MMRTNSLLLRGTLLAATLFILAPAEARRPARVAPQPEVRNVIFMIGDGMGPTAVSAYLLAKDFQGTAFQRAQAVALSTTYSANNRVTDSAASGTALATGEKTGNRWLGMNMDSLRLRSNLERALQAGMPTGIVVTSFATHATPAAFYAHVPNRNLYERIALQLLDAGIDVVFAGGRQDFRGREDGRDLMAELGERGYAVLDTLPSLDTVRQGRVIGLFAEGHMPPASQRGDYLPRAVDKALELLTEASREADKGFFLMVEGSQIDFAAHANDAPELLREMEDFDRTVGVAFDYADRHPGTLVVVTADHETGGLALPSGKEDFTLPESGVDFRFASKSHTAAMTPVFFYGTGAMSMGGILDNTDLARGVRQLLGLPD